MLLKAWSMDQCQVQNGLLSMFNRASTKTEREVHSTWSQISKIGLHAPSIEYGYRKRSKALTTARIPGSEFCHTQLYLYNYMFLFLFFKYDFPPLLSVEVQVNSVVLKMIG